MLRGIWWMGRGMIECDAVGKVEEGGILWAM